MRFNGLNVYFVIHLWKFGPHRQDHHLMPISDYPSERGVRWSSWTSVLCFDFINPGILISHSHNDQFSYATSTTVQHHLAKKGGTELNQSEVHRRADRVILLMFLGPIFGVMVYLKYFCMYEIVFIPVQAEIIFNQSHFNTEKVICWCVKITANGKYWLIWIVSLPLEMLLPL